MKIGQTQKYIFHTKNIRRMGQNSKGENQFHKGSECKLHE